MSILNIVGIGPGSDAHMTPAALKAIQESDHVIGYTTYIRLVKKHLVGKEITRTGMSEEITRAKVAIDYAKEGRKITLISSGDAGVYGMAGLVFDCLREIGWKREDSPKINIIPGISAANSCGSLVGAPLIHDACTISLSDLLTPWPIIENRIENAARGDFVISFYNPASGRRQRQIVEAKSIISKYRSPNTPVALVKSAYRKRQEIIISDLNSFLDFEIGMLTTVIIGSSQTYIYEGYMVTPRGHQNKYNIENGEIKEGQRKTFSLACEGDIKSKMNLKDNNFELAKTYTTPTASWVTPENIHDKSFLENKNQDEREVENIKNEKENKISLNSSESISNALEALEILLEQGLLLGREKSVENKKNKYIETNIKYEIIFEFYGVLYFKCENKEFFIGEFKEPVNLEEHEVIILNEDKSRRYKEIKTNKKIGVALYLWPSHKDSIDDIYNKLIIYRNNSVSKRMKNMIQDSSALIDFKGNEVADTRWLAETPLSIWNFVRDSILKC